MCSQVYMVVVLEVRKEQQVIPIVLMLIDEMAKVLFQFLVDSLGLVITLWVVCNGCCKFDSKKVVQLLGECNELRASI